MSDYLPEWKGKAYRGRYIGLYRYMAGSNWRQLRKNRELLLFDTLHQAHNAAREHVRASLNDNTRAEMAEAPVDALGLDAWRRERDRALNEERGQVFGSMPAKIVFLKGGRTVPIERKRRRIRGIAAE